MKKLSGFFNLFKRYFVHPVKSIFFLSQCIGTTWKQFGQLLWIFIGETQHTKNTENMFLYTPQMVSNEESWIHALL